MRVLAFVLSLILAAGPAFAGPPASAPLNLDGSGNLKTAVQNTPVVLGPGTAGTPSATVHSIQGVAGGTAVPVSGTVSLAQYVAQASATAGLTGPLVLCGVNSAASPGYTTGTVQPFTCNTNGAVRINAGTGANVNPHAFSAPSSAATASIAPMSFASYNSTPYAVPSGQSAPLAMNSAAQLSVDTENLKASYSWSATVTPAATPGDIWTLTGSATKTVRLKHLRAYCNAGAAGGITISLIRRSSANTGGTSTAGTIVKRDTNSAAATAVTALYTANPTTGTPVGAIDTVFLPCALNGAGPAYDRYFGAGDGLQSIVLRGTTDSLALNGNGSALPASPSMAIAADFNEE